jgi:hypothetical protein
MLSSLRFVLPVAVLLAGLAAITKGTYANVRYTKQEKKPCVTCHVTIKGKELNSVGKCFQKKHTLAGCETRE